MITIISLFMITTRQFRMNSQHTLDSQLNTLIYYLQSPYTSNTRVPTISHTWLNQFESSNNLIIHIEENHSDLLYKSSLPLPENRKELINLAMQKAVQQNDFNFYIYSSSDTPLHATSFELKLNNKAHYLVNAASLLIQNHSCQIVLLKDMKEDDLQIRHQFLIYLLLFLMGTFVLTLFSFWFSGHAIAPIIENERSQKAFIAAASHELRSPITVIETNSSALASQYPTIQASLFYTSIKKECQRMTHLISDLLLLSHADTHTNWSLELRPIEIDTLLLEVHDTFYPLAQQSGHDLILHIQEEATPTCMLDAERLTQVLNILISNALDYTPTGCSITLALSFPSSYELCISVIDDGPGIADQYKPLVFQRFYRIDSSRHKKEHTGLGLSIAYELIKLHKGKLTLVDTLPHGCTFNIFLPINQASPSTK